MLTFVSQKAYFKSDTTFHINIIIQKTRILLNKFEKIRANKNLNRADDPAHTL